MPIYEYEPDDRECFLCDGKVEVLQSVHEEALKFCPTCGLEVKRIISRASIQMAPNNDPDRAAKRGFSTYKKVGKGQYEKIAGADGPSDFDAANAPLD